MPGVPASPAPQPAVALQCVSLLDGSMHSPPQLTCVPGQLTEHPLGVHTLPVAWQLVPALPASPAPHPAVAPQYWLLLLGSMHWPPQLISVPAHESAQERFVHTWPGAHAFPALPASPAPQPAVAPQNGLLVVGSMHVPPQLISLPGHDTAHSPLPHTWPGGHPWPAVPAPPTPQPAVAPQC